MRIESVTADRVLIDGEFRPATLTITAGRISSIEPSTPGGSDLQVAPTACVIPGIVDTHVHVNEPGRTEWEGFVTATEAAAHGGVSTLIDMPLNSIPPTTTIDGLAAKRAAAAGELMVDVGFWGGAIPGNHTELEPMWDAGVFGFKCFLSPSGVEEFPHLDPEEFRLALGEVARIGGLMIVHAEDAAVLEAAPSGPSRAYADFLISRPDEAETTAITQVLHGARETGARVHILHLSSARALGIIADARAEGLPVTVETCPHYLCLAAEQIPDGAAEFKCCPPIRDAGNRDELWQALRDGIIDAVVSDHSPSTLAEKHRGNGDLQQAWGGISGLQVGFTAVAAEARARGIGLESVSRWMSRNTADLVGLSRKGRIEVGADADLTIYDPGATLHVDAHGLAHRNPISAYDGLTFTGRVTHSLVRGNTSPDHAWGRLLDRTLTEEKR